MTAWIKVVTLPLGLVAFALFLLYKFTTTRKQATAARWSFLVTSILVMLGGLGLGYLQIRKSSSIPSIQAPAPSRQQSNQVQQDTTGPGSPAIQGVQGDVTVTVDQSSGKTKDQKVQEQKPQPK